MLRPGFADPPGMTIVEHLTFSLRYDGVNPAVLAAIFAAIDGASFEQELQAELTETPNGQYLRRLWFLYEWLTERCVEVPLQGKGVKYIRLLDDRYVTGPERHSPRHRVINNLLGVREFCPMVRKTDLLQAADPQRLHRMLTQLVAEYDQAVLLRAIAYLYTKETLSSFAIESERPSKTREQRFVRLLRGVHDSDPWSEKALAVLQSQIVDERFAETEYRAVQNFVGQSIGLAHQYVHYVPPKPEDVSSLMSGLTETARTLLQSDTDAVVTAACLSFGFVFIHPFTDGNGRLHRLLIHSVLAQRGITPRDVVAPVSAVMLADRRGYDAVLEGVSKAIGALVDYELSEGGDLEVLGDTVPHYRYLDYTTAAEAMYVWLERAIKDDLVNELDFLVGIERTREAMSAIVDMPNKDADLFIKCCLQNAGKLSATKREHKTFVLLREEEIERLERAVREGMPARAISRA